MGTTRRCLLFVLSFVLLSTALSGVFSDKVHAASVYDNVIKTGGNFTVTDNYSAAGGICGQQANTQDLSGNYTSFITDPTKYVGDTSHVSDAITAWNSALDSGKGWGVVQITNKFDGLQVGNSYLGVGDKYLMVVWSASPNLVFGTSTDGTSVLSTDGTSDFYTASISFNGFNHGYPNPDTCEIGSQLSYIPAGYTTNPVQHYPSVQVDSSGANTYTSVFLNFNITYPDSYAGTIPPSTATPAHSAYFSYAVDTAGRLSGVFNQNTPIESGMQWSWTLSETDSQYANPTQLDHQTLGISDVYTYKPLQTGHYYTLNVKMYAPIPYAPPANDYDTTFQIFYFGQFIGHSSDASDCSNGVCANQTAVCTTSGDVWLDLGCTLQKSTSIGVLNPSINAFKTLMSSFIVPSSPTCSLTLPNVGLPYGNTFNFTSFGGVICDDSARLRSAIPLAPLLVNFALALLILRLWVGIVNELLDDKRSDVVGGIQ